LSFAVTGFGAQQFTPSPQVFQALSLDRQPPVPPAPPYGTPNADLVPVARTGNPAVPANLTLAAHPTFSAILKVNQSVLATTQFAVSPTPYSTAAVDANSPAVSGQLQGPLPSGVNSVVAAPEGPISFGLTAPPASDTADLTTVQATVSLLHAGQQQFSQTPQDAQGAPRAPGQDPPAVASTPGTGPAQPAPVGSSAPAAPGTTTPAPASPSLVAQIVQTVQNIAIAAIYPGPIFSFSA